MLSDVFGWDPFFEVTKEYAIRATYVDLAVQRDGLVAFLIEVKAIGGDLKDNHLRQAVNYAANKGIEWVVLTNAETWRAYKVIFAKPVSHELVFDMEVSGADAKDPSCQEKLFVLTKEGMTKSAIALFHEEQQALSRFNVAAILRSENVVKIVRREIRRAYPKLRPSLEEVELIITRDVLKREVVQGGKAEEAMKLMKKAARPQRRPRKKEAREPSTGRKTEKIGLSPRSG
ncbi:MAG: type I restriction enzyme HsdR N-terminal domain-containing protein [Gemmatimonadota bacterium]